MGRISGAYNHANYIPRVGMEPAVPDPQPIPRWITTVSITLLPAAYRRPDDTACHEHRILQHCYGKVCCLEFIAVRMRDARGGKDGGPDGSLISTWTFVCTCCSPTDGHSLKYAVDERENENK